jgi:hypothetical protein
VKNEAGEVFATLAFALTGVSLFRCVVYDGICNQYTLNIPVYVFQTVVDMCLTGIDILNCNPLYC